MNIIIIGLPCSGKSHLCDNFEKEGYKIYDDFISHFYNGNLIKDLENKINICVADPRLCDFKIFEKFICYFKSPKLILYENNPEQCLQNLKNRERKIGISKSIHILSNVYNLDNYKKYNYLIIPVFN